MTNPFTLRQRMTARWQKSLRQERSFALIAVLLMLAVMTMISTGFMVSMRTEYLTAHSYLNILRATLAVESAKNDILTRLESYCANDRFMVISTGENETPYYFIGDAAAGSEQVNYHPLFSGATSVLTNANALPAPAWVETSDEAFLLADPQSRKQHVPTRWIPLLASGDSTSTVRYGYWVEDLGASIDALTAGNTQGLNNFPLRNTGTNPNEIALFTLFNPTVTNTTDPSVTAILENRQRLLTSQTIFQITTAPGSSHLVVNGHYDTNEPQLIPYGLGYPDEGKIKYDINRLIKEGGPASVAAISQVIQDNLPDFGPGRQGGFSGSDYVSSLAANIIDYADTDSQPTRDGGLRGYRGIDSYPFVNLIFDRIAWVSGTGLSHDPVIVNVTTFVDLWNPCNQTTTSSHVSIINKNRLGLTLGGTRLFGDETFPVFALTLPPNGHAVKNLGTHTYRFINGTGLAAASNPVYFTRTTTDSTFELYWNGALVDTFRGGAERTGSDSGSFLPQGNTSATVRYKGNAVNLNYPEGQVGDPRSSFHFSDPVRARSYDDSTAWGGRQFSSSIDNPDYKEVLLSRWPDPSHDGPIFPAVARNIPSGSDATQAAAETPGSTAANVPQNGRGTWRGFGAGTLPSQILLPANLPQSAPGRISNSGRYRNIAELGNIYDPGQWKNITNTSTLPSSAAGGGFTLRIGQGEFPQFNRNGLRSSQLLDLFCVTDHRDTTGLINLNSASFDTLRALATGLRLETDPALQPASLARSLYPPTKYEQADIVARTIISNRPYLSVSQLSGVTNESGFLFGNPRQWPKDPPTMWSDEAREELFARIVNLTTTRSRSFRIFVTGQTLDPQGKVVAQSSRVLCVFLKPQRDTTITNSIAEVFYEREM